jgi:phytanoyl-CoA hydroxylase
LATGDDVRRQFQRDGYVILRDTLPARDIEAMRTFALDSLEPALAPLEFESDINYPGAPADRRAEGGDTPRRLLNVYSRSDMFRRLGGSAPIVDSVKRLLGSERLALSQNHHNCLMTKHLGYNSATLWHQDIRYWSFDKPELISAWLALGEETPDNGGLWMLPGSHRLELDRGRLDAALFLRPELKENRKLIEDRVSVGLHPGDVWLFHCRTFHAAGRNATDRIKLSVVFTYRSLENRPIPGTRSDHYADIPMG